MRTSADIIIHKVDGTTVTVPITPEARRVYRLMSEDNIRLTWLDTTPYKAAVGDYADDELFGRFYVTEAQDPDYDTATGAYKNNARLDREYIGWRNILHQLTVSDGGTLERRETEWVLTDSIQSHLNEVLRNLEAAGYVNGTAARYTGTVESSVENADTAISISFSGTSVHDALTAIANAWNCEWWVTYTVSQGVTSGVIHLGKCENGTEYSITLGDNAERVNPSKNDSEYASKIYAYGSTRNIPETYRKSLVFTVTHTESQTYDGQTATVYRDSARVITRDMLAPGGLAVPSETTLSLTTPSYSDTTTDPAYRYKATFDGHLLIDRKARFSPAASLSYVAYFVRGESEAEEETASWAWKLALDNTVLSQGGGTFGAHEIVNGNASKTFSATLSDTLTLPFGEHYLTVEVWTESPLMVLSTASANNGKVTLTPTGFGYKCSLGYEGNTYQVTFNPLAKDFTRESFNWFAFTGSAPSGFGVGEQYTLDFSDSDGLRLTKVPSSYYTDDHGDTSGLKTVGARRLMLPYSTCPGGYVYTGSDTVNRVVERVVLFENEYPKVYLQITELEVGTYSDTTEYADGSKTLGTLPRYTLKAGRITSQGTTADFDFKNEYLTSDPLSAVFVTRDQAHANGSVSTSSHKLSGMTFGLRFNEQAQTYTVVWNEDYGTKLPNGTLKPEVGDAFILTGWNVKAIESLGLVGDAEDRLETSARAYLSAVSEPQMTYTCVMMSDSALDDGLLGEGRRVSVNGNSTRVIGYELKLDIPEDSPQYTCGETDAYSRLRTIEKLLRAQTQSVSAGGNTSSSGVSSPSSQTGGDGGVADKVGEPLAWVSGPGSSFTGDSFDGSESKVLTIPTDVDHLIGSGSVPRIESVVGETTGGYIVRLRDGEGNLIFPQSNNDWFIAETYDDGGVTKRRLKLNPVYEGMYAEGWVSGGGLSSGGGGGGGGDYLPLAGGEMSGDIYMPAGNSTNSGPTLYFRHANSQSGYTFDAYIGANNGGTFAVFARNDIRLRPGNSSSYGLVISTTDVTFNGTSILGSQYVLPAATANALGGIKTGYALNEKNYPVQLSGENRAYVNVPWTDTVYTLPLAASGTRGGIKIGYSQSGKNYPVQLSSEKAYVTVPWTDTVYTHPTGGANTTITAADGRVLSAITVNNLGHVTSVSAKTLTASDIPTLAYLPLSAGSAYPLTGPLHTNEAIYSRSIFPKASNTYNIGYFGDYYYKRCFCKRFYLDGGDTGDGGVYLYYDSTNQCVRVHGAGFASDSFISGGGISTT